MASKMTSNGFKNLEWPQKWPQMTSKITWMTSQTASNSLKQPKMFSNALFCTFIWYFRVLLRPPKNSSNPFLLPDFHPEGPPGGLFLQGPFLLFLFYIETNWISGRRRGAEAEKGAAGSTYYYHPIFLGNVHWNVDLAKEKRSKNFPKHRIKALIAL